MSNYIAITREHLKALLDAALADAATPADSPIIITAMQELELPAPTANPTSEGVRACFEEACKASKTYKFPLGIVTMNGQFKSYMDSDTDSAHVGYRAGFVRGLKWHQQVAQTQATIEVQSASAEAQQQVEAQS